jgi:5-methylcytosine-specific restriction protein A
MCEAMGKVEKASEVDHIVPHKGDDLLRLDPENLESLCSWHHKSKTARERQHK